MVLPILCTAAGMLLLVVFCLRRIKGASPTVAMTKAVTSLLFIATALSAVAFTGFDFSYIRFAAFIIMGLTCGMLGDIALDLKYAHKKSSDQYTYAGFISFLTGHIFYDIALISTFYEKGNILYIVIPAAVCLLAAVVIRFSEKPLKVNYGKFRAIVVLYTPFLLSLMAFSFSMALLHGFKNVGLDIVFGGSVLFVISDFILNGTYFGTGKDRSVDVVTNHATYYLAQFAIAFSLCFICG